MGSPAYLLVLFPGAKSSQKRPFWEKQFILDSGFLPHLGRWDNLSTGLSALTLEFLAAKLKVEERKRHDVRKQNSKKHKPQISTPQSSRLLWKLYLFCPVSVSYSVAEWWENQLYEKKTLQRQKLKTNPDNWGDGSIFLLFLGLLSQ